jgi:long-subunit acyl-CoA synthetase (AMP-forming)
VKTGDRVRLSEHHLYVEGRFKNTLINSFGRNISPEWIEAELIATGCFQRAVVVGDEQPVCGAFLQPIHSNISDEKLALVIAQLNRKLPDYAQIKCWATLATDQWTQPGLYTQNGKLIRSQFVQQFAEQIQQLFTPIALADKVEEQYDAIL